MVPTVGPSPGEQKTKPTQHSVKELRSLGLTPDFIVCRSKDEVRTICACHAYVDIYTLCSEEEVPMPALPTVPTMLSVLTLLTLLTLLTM